MMKIENILNNIRPLEVKGTPESDITGISDDSRDVQDGYLFFAIQGVAHDGHRFVPGIRAKAAAAVVEQFVETELPQIRVADTREAFSKALELFYGISLDGIRFTGVTGTNGKTTFTYLMESIFNAAGKKAGVIGTVNYRCGDRAIEASHTTPALKQLFPVFREFTEAGCKDVIMEVSSHALSQGRVRGILFDVAVFTNLTQDHLDFHKNMEDYYQSKKRLFTEYLKPGAAAVINVDDPYGERLLNELGGNNTKGFSFAKKADYRCNINSMDNRGVEVSISGRDAQDTVSSPLQGRYNAYNIVTAYLAALSLGIGPDTVRAGISGLKRVPGRLEEIPNTLGIKVFVDYAHTPDALLNVLRAMREMREMTRGRVITVFGCGGDRDKGKRPMMGEIATKYSEVVIVTSDNPRTEDPLAIIGEIKKGLSPIARTIIQPDRAKAIYDAVFSARPDDVILIAGKGHEDYQITGTEKTFFSDQKVVEEALKKRQCVAGLTN